MYKGMSSDAIALFNNERQSVKISVELTSGKDIEPLTEEVVSKFKIERSSVSGDNIELGSARAFELTFTLDNSDGRFDGVNFDGAKIYGNITVKDGNGKPHSIPFGRFTVDGHETDGHEIEITALDRMVWLDKIATWNGVTFPVTPTALISHACAVCGVDGSNIDFSDCVNADYSILSPPTEKTTWRQIVMWALEILGNSAFIDAEGYFTLAWYKSSGQKITPANRYSHKIFENNATVTGVVILDSNAEYVYGQDGGLVFTINENPLITHDFESVAQNLGRKLVGFTHRPFTANILSSPYLFPFDMLTFVTSNGKEYPVCITNFEFTLNGDTVVQGAGESEATSGYAALNPLTERERAIIAATVTRADNELKDEISEREQAIIRMNEVMANAFGLYQVQYTETDGSTQYYFCDKPTLEESNIIYVFNAGGFAWANKWGGSNSKTEWKYGITKDGNAVLNFLSVNKLTADYIDATTLHITKSININNNFIVDEDGNVAINGSIQWGTSNSPTQVLYASTVLAKPKSIYTNYPATSEDGWHRVFNKSADKYASYTYDGGRTWTDVVLIVGEKGKDGAKGDKGDSGKFWVSEQTIDLTATTYNQDKYYPVIGTAYDTNRGLEDFRVFASFNGSTPAWGTHSSKQFSVNFEFRMRSSGWGCTRGECIVDNDTFEYCAVSPVSCAQIGEASIPVLYLRGGGKYTVRVSFNCSWTPYANGYTWTNSSGEYSHEMPVCDSRPTPRGAYDNAVYSALTADNTFNALTNNGTKFGCFSDQNGKLYINAEYIKSNFIRVGNTAYDDGANYLIGGRKEAVDKWKIAVGNTFGVTEDGGVYATKGRIACLDISDSQIKVGDYLAISKDLIKFGESAYIKADTSGNGEIVGTSKYTIRGGNAEIILNNATSSNNAYKVSVKIAVVDGGSNTAKFTVTISCDKVFRNLNYKISVSFTQWHLFNWTDTRSYTIGTYSFSATEQANSLTKTFSAFSGAWDGSSAYSFTYTIEEAGETVPPASWTMVSGSAAQIGNGGGTVTNQTTLSYSSSSADRQILIVGDLAPNTPATSTSSSGYDIGVSTKYWRYVYARGCLGGSDRKIKYNIETLSADLSQRLISLLQPRQYLFREAATPRPHYGFIAQEVEEALKTLGLTTSDNGLVCKSKPDEEDGEDNFYALNYIDLIAPIIRVLQLQNERINKLQGDEITDEN